jgi:hypothetical protein
LLEFFDGGVKRWSEYPIDNKAKVGGSAQGPLEPAHGITGRPERDRRLIRIWHVTSFDQTGSAIGASHGAHECCRAAANNGKKSGTERIAARFGSPMPLSRAQGLKTARATTSRTKLCDGFSAIAIGDRLCRCVNDGEDREPVVGPDQEIMRLSDWHINRPDGRSEY